MYTIYYYPTCNTCKKALKWLESHGVEVTLKHIVDETPSSEILKEVLINSGLPLKKLFNTSGKKYRELNMKEKQLTMTDDEVLELLSTEGMLIKRPILVGQGLGLIGFNEKEWEAKGL